MNKIKGFLIALGICATAVAVDAAIVGSSLSLGLVKNFYVYPDYGGGDVVFETEFTHPGCHEGFWLRPTDPGFKTAYAALLTAYSSKSAVRMWAYTDSLWPGSSGQYCRVYAISPA